MSKTDLKKIPVTVSVCISKTYNTEVDENWDEHSKYRILYNDAQEEFDKLVEQPHKSDYDGWTIDNIAVIKD